MALSSTGLGQEPGPRGPSPGTRPVLGEIAKAYRGLTAYSDEGVVQLDFVSVPNKGVDKPKTVRAKAQLLFARPNKLALTYGSLRLISDGKEMTTVLDRYKRYFVAKAPKEITLETFRSDQMRELLFRDTSGLYLQILLTLLLGREPTSDVLIPFQIADPVPTERLIDGKKCVCLKFTTPVAGESQSLLFGERLEIRLLVDPDSKYLQGVDLELPVPRHFYPALPSPPPDLPPGLEGTVIEAPIMGAAVVPKTVRWVPGVITAGIQPISRFTFERPQDYQRVNNFDDLFDQMPPAIAPQPRVEVPVIQ
jgi:hypothetical protein